MRVLIISAFLTYAAAAHSGIIAPVFYQSLAIPAVGPTISPGDIQAAAINAQVKYNDLARAAADKAQEIADQAVSADVKSVPSADLVEEKNVETFWSNEEKKWQALDALKTAEAQIDGAVASNAGAYAKSSIEGTVYVAARSTPVIPPVVYNPYLVAVKSISTQTEVKSEENKEEKKEVEVKTAEPEKPAESAAKTEVEAEKSADKPNVLANTIVTPYSSVYTYNFAAQPLFKYASIQPVHSIFAPTYYKTVW